MKCVCQNDWREVKKYDWRRSFVRKNQSFAPNLKQKAIDFVESLQSEVVPKQKKKSLKGALSHLNVRVTEENIQEARNEMWRGYTEDTESEK
ncbi:hypothetical protein BH24ACI1_BH24ACI1_26960 [soil metagenome]